MAFKTAFLNLQKHLLIFCAIHHFNLLLQMCHNIDVSRTSLTKYTQGIMQLKYTILWFYEVEIDSYFVINIQKCSNGRK